MRKRIKKYYEDHQEDVLSIGGAILAGVVVTAIYQIADSNRIMAADVVTTDEGVNAILMFKKNGRIRVFTKAPVTMR